MLSHLRSCSTSACLDHHFLFDCPGLQPVRDYFPQLCQGNRRALVRPIWQVDVVAVVHFIAQGSDFRRSLLGRL